MNDGKGIAIFAIIVSLISLGLGGYVVYDLILTSEAPEEEQEDPLDESDVQTIVDETIANSSLVNESSVDNTLVTQWYKEWNSHSFDSVEWEYLDPLSFVINLNESSSLYASFNGYIRFVEDSGLYVNFRVENTEVGQEMRVEAENVNFRQRYSVALQYYDPSLGPGSYNISVWARVGSDLSSFHDMSLYIQTVS
ncbi:MAG: hypothetical protein BAJALOKI2v1_150044 [Promethearchaeota archaeon]|nr:MAG: hypothetical protein BAJALOKI2v1_150044 [Candidatus Lokiarchaeota archaeon]